LNQVMTENDWRGKMLAWKKDRSVTDGMELIDAYIADLEREKAQAEQKKNPRRKGRVLGLRNRLGVLVALILSQTHVRGKGEASRDPAQ